MGHETYSRGGDGNGFSAVTADMREAAWNCSRFVNLKQLKCGTEILKNY
jgi:hypothetical protein